MDMFKCYFYAMDLFIKLEIHQLPITIFKQDLKIG